MYRSALTSRALLLSLPVLVVAGYLLLSGALASGKFGPTDPFRIPFVLGPALLGLIILGALSWGVLQNLGQEVRLEKGFCTYQKGGRGFTAPWGSLVVSQSRTGPVKLLVLSDGKAVAYLMDVFHPDFERLSAELTRRAKRAHDRPR